MAAKQFLVPISLNQLPVQGIVLENLGAAPASPVEGRLYADTGAHVARYYNGSAFISFLDRAQHTGTQLAATISNLAATVQAYSLSSFAAPTGNIPMAGFTFTGLSTAPNAAGQAAEYSWTLAQITSAIEGRNTKDAVRMASTGNLALTGLQTVDGIAGAANDRLLVKNQTAGAENGIYVMQTGAWTRAPDQNAPGEYRTGDFVFVEFGASQAATNWTVSTTGTITIGTTPVTWTQVGAAASYVAGNGLTLTGNTFAVGAGTGIVVSAGTTAIDTAAVLRKYNAQITGDGATTSFPLTHNLNNANPNVVVRLASSGARVEIDDTATSANAVSIIFGVAPASGAIYNVGVHG